MVDKSKGYSAEGNRSHWPLTSCILLGDTYDFSICAKTPNISREKRTGRKIEPWSCVNV